MLQINKVQIPANSGFKLERAIELANLISVAYNEFEVWDWIENSTSERALPPKIITGSNAFVDLYTNNLEEVAKNNNKIIVKNYEQLNQFWNQKQDKLRKYNRVANFWFPQWWWGEVLKAESLLDFFKKDIRNIWQNFKDLIGEDQIFGFIARSQTETNQIFVVFRGTREPAEWFNNFRPVPKTFLEDEDLGFRVINSEDLIQAVPLPTTQVVDNETLDGMSPAKKARFLSFRTFLEGITGGQAGKLYQHVGLPITFTKQTGTIAGNHNLTRTYREALDIGTGFLIGDR